MPDSSENRRRGSALSIDQHEVDDRTVVVALAGELDLWSAPQLKRTLSDLLDSGRDRLILDLSGVAFMDSTALGVMIGIQRRLAGDDRMAIAGAGPEVRRMFELSGLAASFPIFPTRDAALGYLTNSEAGLSGSAVPPLTTDAALMLGIASTAMPFARSTQDQAERWLRALRRHGESGAVLGSLGVREGSIGISRADAGPTDWAPGDPEAVATVTEHASRVATGRGAPKVATSDVLLAVMHVYGATFDRVLAAHGVDIEELAARLATPQPASANR